jgi:hypothetical protein
LTTLQKLKNGLNMLVLNSKLGFCGVSRYGSPENRNERSLSFDAEEMIRLNFGPDL